MRWPLMSRAAFGQTVAELAYLAEQRLDQRFQPLQFFLLGVDGVVEILQQVFLQSEFGFDFDQALVGHGSFLPLRRQQ